MGGATLHIHEPRLGAGLPARTVRPFFRTGDEVLAAFLRALEEPADAVAVSGRLFEAREPPAHLAGRVAEALRAVAARGARVSVPRATPCPLLFCAAGVALDGGTPPGGAPEFCRTGAFVRIEEGRRAVRRCPLPGERRIVLDLTGLTTTAALERISRRVAGAAGARAVRLVLTGTTREVELRSFSTRALLHHLPGGVPGCVDNRLRGDGDAAAFDFPDDGARQAALLAAQERLPLPPAATGVYEFLGADGRVLYVGKAVDLRRRIASHFSAERREPSPRGSMLLAARGLVFRETGSEVLALLLEAERIREARPPYNRRMRETEACRYLRAGLDEPLPALRSVPRPDAGAPCFGPFPKRWVLERGLRAFSVLYGLPCCAWTPGTSAPAACTDRDLGLCAAPCAGRVTLEECRRRASAALDDLLGRAAGPPAFGQLNSASSGLLTPEDVRVSESLRRQARFLVRTLREANGVLPLPDGRAVLVLSGLAAAVRKDTAAARASMRRRLAEHVSRPPPTFVPAARAEEVRILARALRG